MTRQTGQAGRYLILACEMAGLLHDFGKLHPGFAREKLDGGGLSFDRRWSANGINNAHGAILEDDAAYPDANERVVPPLAELLARLRSDSAWAEVLALPPEFGVPPGSQLAGLGGPLRQHHAGDRFPSSELSFLGDLYMYGADWRDSALDKGAGGSAGTEQAAGRAEIADSLGQHALPFGADGLTPIWCTAVEKTAGVLLAPGSTDDLIATRRSLTAVLEPLFRNALGETRRPTNDVTLWHHSRSAASHFKAAVAEGVLRGSFSHLVDDKGQFNAARLGRVRFRLLGIRWDWARLTARALRPVTLFSLAQARAVILDGIATLVEEDLAFGNVIYSDDDGALVLAPGFYEADDAVRSEQLFGEHVVARLRDPLDAMLGRLGSGTAYRLAWSEPVLYLTDYREAVSHPHPDRVEYRQARVAELRAQWAGLPQAGGQVQICPECGLRPALAPTQEGSILDETRLCTECSSFGDKTRAGREAKAGRRAGALAMFGIEPETLNLQELCLIRGGGSRRAVLLSVRVDGDWLASGNALITQLARPAAFVDGCRDANAMADELGRGLAALNRGGIKHGGAEQDRLRNLLGDQHWLTKGDGRAEEGDPLARGLRVANDFLLRESAPLADCRDARASALGLVRNDGDRLALFAMRRHASPARLARLWEDLRVEWKALLAEIHGIAQGCVIPLSLDGRGLAFIVAGADADETLTVIQRRLTQVFAKVRGGFAPHVSAVAFRDKFPLYVALDALGRLESRIGAVPWQRWTLVKAQDVAGPIRRLHWNTADGEVVWDVDLATADPDRPDRWLPHLVVLERGGKVLKGPERLVHVSELASGDVALAPPATFDFANLETTTRRHALRWAPAGEALARPHLVFGALGRPAHHLEQYAIGSGVTTHTLGLRDLIRATGWQASKLKKVVTLLSETYAAWVRDAPKQLQNSGHVAWLGFVEATLGREFPGTDRAALRAGLAEAIANGRFFDACEWMDFIGGGANAVVPGQTMIRRSAGSEAEGVGEMRHV